MLKLIFIAASLLFISVKLTPHDGSMQHEPPKLELKILTKQLNLDAKRQSLNLQLRIFNRSNEKVKLYLSNKWNDLCPVDWIPEHADPGFNIGIFDNKDKQIHQKIFIFDTEEGLQKIWSTILDSGDSASAVLEKHFTGADLAIAPQKPTLDSIKTLSPGDSITAELEIDFFDYFLKKGEYELIIYYVVNEKVVEHVHDPKGLFKGYVRSNKVQLIVKEESYFSK